MPPLTNKVSLHDLPSADDIESIKQALKDAIGQLSQNLIEYDQLSQLIMKPSPRYEWFARVKQRAAGNARIYKENNELHNRIVQLCRLRYDIDINDYDNQLKYTDLDRLSQHNINFYAFRTLLNDNFVAQGRFLPFLSEEISTLYEKDMVERMPDSEITLVGHAISMFNAYESAMLGDTTSIEPLVEYARKVLAFEDRFDSFSCEEVRYRFLQAYYCKTYAAFFDKRRTGFTRTVEIWKRYQAFYQKHPNCLEFTKESYRIEVRRMENHMKCFIPTLAIDYHDKITDAKQCQWLQLELRKFANDYQDPSPENYYLFVRAKYILGDWTGNEAYEILNRYYMSVAYKSSAENSTYEVILTFQICKAFLQLLHATNYPIEIKDARSIQTIDWILNRVKSCENKNFGYEISHMTYDFLRDPQTNGMLTTALRHKFVQGVLRTVLVPTYAHTRMVSYISEEILHGVISFRPELLVGTMGIKSTDEVASKALVLDNYMLNASKVHDIGKFSMIQIVNNSYIKLTDHEFEIIKLHPSLGVEICDSEPAVEPYRNAILRHHLWYNLQGGYPESEWGRKTPYDFLINILQIADSLEAGSDHMGRSYSCTKSFSELVDEINAQAGTRYNPDLADLIKNTQVLYDSLKNAIENCWEYNYYEVFLDFFNKR